MKWRAKSKSFEQYYEIVQEPSLGFYLYVFENGECTYDYLQETLELSFECAEEFYGIPKDAWEQIESTSHAASDFQKNIDILELIILRITKYFNKSMYIGDLISHLVDFLNQLNMVDIQWKKKFWTFWADLEIEYALALDQGLEDISYGGNIIIDRALQVLKKMTEEKLVDMKTYLKISDPYIKESAIVGDDVWLICSKCIDAWEDNSSSAMVICPKCKYAFHNPRIS